ncbi:AfsR/SARP family transcriptional regulator [Deinococcus arenicola]|uniref:Bacterial transcriptional activator domain-containing protein n=1 Tax=Deinococcus arenicola TaxID=2994950 RepID=A0ABU4DM91_9DEIO|nr:bacterial transcriptional activator domain-containing protein [Deinococcus sp. ZS9-10]MDV6373554.1 bacterial transcriptional activator domain-containing protein [Deinococcus sp. ZS9-10]
MPQPKPGLSPPTAPPQRYLLRSLGHADVIVDGTSVVWPARSAEELLWYLHAHPQGRYRHDILAGLWGLDDTPATANRFRVALHRLRATLGRPDAVLEERGRYSLHPELHASSDTHALHTALDSSRQSSGPRQQEELLRQALASADGEYLPHLQGEWVEAARTQHRAAVVEGHLTLSTLHCAARECPLAALALVRAAEADPLIGEDHHQRLMVCLTMTRDKYAAIEHYRRYRHYLAAEVGDTPMQDTVDLAERLKADERPCIHSPYVPAGKVLAQQELVQKAPAGK